MNVVIKIDDDTKKEMIDYYKDKIKEVENKPPYVVFIAKEEDTTITMYESGKVMFQGKSADVDASHWGIQIQESKENKNKKNDKDSVYYNSSSIGSDEVGTGDYFGPVVVSATYVSKDDIKFLEELGVDDSKKLTDDKILAIAPKIIKKIKYSSQILRNDEYNEKYNKDLNLNKIKSIMHNKVLLDMTSKVDKYDYIIVDQFAYEESYYNYLKDQERVQRDITFITKAESKNLAVAAASIISRYIFLKEMDKLSDEVHVPLPKGAGPEVDKIGEELVDKYGEEILDKIAKKNFKNTLKILHALVI